MEKHHIAYERPLRASINRGWVSCVAYLKFFPLIYPCLYLLVSVFMSAFLSPRRKFIYQPILKYDISTGAYLLPMGISESRFEIETGAKKLF